MQATATYKLCIFGEARVGKTSLTRRYLTGIFDLDVTMTMGAEIFVKYIEIENKRIALQIWDFGGEEKFKFLLPIYATGSNAGIFMFDLTREATLKKIDDWLTVFKKGIAPNEEKIPILMVGGKLDLQEERSCSKEDAVNLLKTHDLHYYIECSAKTGENIERIFEIIANAVTKSSGFI